MKLGTKTNTYKASNCSLYISEDMTEIEAYSYDWWLFVTTDKAGNVIFNNTTYSQSTNKHQRDVSNILNRLSIKTDIILTYTKLSLGNGNEIKYAINAEIANIKRIIKDRIKHIRKKGSHRKTNLKRKRGIRKYWYQIKDLRNYRDNYIDKKPIPKKKKSLKNYNKDYIEHIIPHFKNKNGKLDKNKLINFNNKYGTIRTYRSIIYDNIKTLLNFKSYNNVEPFLLYRYVSDINNMIPNEYSREYIQLKRWLKSQDITRDNLNAFKLDKLHEYLVNKQNRKSYDPREAVNFKVHPVLAELETKFEDLKVIKTDVGLRSEGRKQSHCIGSKGYIQGCKLGFQALNYKGFTFWLDPNLEIKETSGRFNSETPREVRSDLNNLILSIKSKRETQDKLGGL